MLADCKVIHMHNGTHAIKTAAASVLPEGFLVGHAQDDVHATGCTVAMCKKGAVAGVSVRGAAPATMETDLLDPRNTVDRINAVILSGGSAFGLESVSGARSWLSERSIGFSFAGACIPIVCGASIFDLTVGSASRFPDKEMGYAACEAAVNHLTTGNVGAGIGASVGKILGVEFSMKGGLGCASLKLNGLVITALVVVNAVGNIYNRELNSTIAGVINPTDRTSIIDPYEAFSLILQSGATQAAVPLNTTISCVMTNGTLTKSQANQVADMVHDGYARSIEPVHTGFDGDTVFVLSSATLDCSPDLIGIFATRVMEYAIHDAIYSASSAYGLISSRDFFRALS